jgi:GNAT superfamily N-acetyltransferase
MVRPATVDDLTAILALIHELAAYERHPEAVHVTDEQLRGALFGPRPAVFAHVAEDGAAVVGVAVWFVTYSTWTGRHGMHLEDLVVREAARGKGLGRELVGALVRICAERDYPRLEWRVLDWNVDAQRFYTSLGAAPMPEWITWRLTR